MFFQAYIPSSPDWCLEQGDDSICRCSGGTCEQDQVHIWRRPNLTRPHRHWSRPGKRRHNRCQTHHLTTPTSHPLLSLFHHSFNAAFCFRDTFNRLPFYFISVALCVLLHFLVLLLYCAACTGKDVYTKLIILYGEYKKFSIRGMHYYRLWWSET